VDLVHVGPPIEAMVFGMELVLDIGGCEPHLLESETRLGELSRDLVEVLEMKAYGPCEFWHFGHDDPVTAGYTMETVASGSHNRTRQLIETSSIVGHFSPYLGTAHLNIFSCRRFDVVRAGEFCRRRLGPQAYIAKAVLIVR
jgi:S-adenosylmethionine/arginine decarboxylase-like enzyme